MPNREHILPLLPGLRRFAVALMAPQETRSCREADEAVARAVQTAAMEEAADRASLRAALYAALIRIAQGREQASPTPVQRRSIADGLLALQIQHRAALLLVALEGFSYDEAAAALGVSRNVLVGRLATARQILSAQTATHGAGGARRPVPHLRLVK